LGILFTVDDKGEDKVVWRRQLVNCPSTVYLSDSGRVVTMDNAATHGYEHSLVLYDLRGKVKADYSLEALLSKEEIAKNVKKTVSSRWWTEGADRGFSFIRTEDAMVEVFTIKLRWGRVITLDLDKGTIK
jgi:hypothetical protein